MKKVLFFTTSGNYNGGGVMCLIETLRYINRDTIEPHVVITTHGTTEEKLKELAIPYIIIRSYDWLYSDSTIHSLSFKLKRPLRWIVNQMAEIRIQHHMKKEHYDAYHLNSVYSNFGVHAAMSLKIPIFWHLREFVDENLWTSTFLDERKAYQTIAKSHQLIAVSNCVMDYYQQKMPAARIGVVYDGVDFSDSMTVREKVQYHTPLRLSMIGGVTAVKGHIDAIRAVAILVKMGVKCTLTIYGRCRDKVYQNSLLKAVEDLGIKSSVTFAGNRTEMKNVWLDTDIVLVCSKSESFGRVAVEAMYQNIPVVGADNSGTKELLKHSILAALYKTGNSQDLSEKIVYITNRNFENAKLQENHQEALRFSAKRSALELGRLLEN